LTQACNPLDFEGQPEEEAEMTKSTRSRTGVQVPRYIWLLLLVLAGAVTFRAVTTRSSSHHPVPRRDVTAADVIPAARYAAEPSIAEAYAYARQHPEVLDGLHCYCDCARNFNHRSLLTCFESDHGADCQICLREAVIAGQLTAQGRSLDEIRATIDGMFRSS
jgi:hypothetical protein